jgi:hypothetical protein
MGFNIRSSHAVPAACVAMITAKKQIDRIVVTGGDMMPEWTLESRA